ncbi:hypothetical protein Srot_2842 [Segniliparus rotundus DSM 44985]|uniref:Uncharacterized protein n=1 Tax=Segniliparus rotundus (strain ATCC BAA-972 / CDC 1076 / CIP 108378 / DSM 44985 / JCM 13578) TaxID=640132 RepID=D6ZDL6_SEGRD|nr:hypothetical protein [Segniliparus rotundus]ADG99273.1 hypothetical protein Srot_2842 [Segniliparus rotundus DSM 44985]
MPGRDAETPADRPFDATTSPEGGEPGRELDILAEQPEPFEVVDAEAVDEAPVRPDAADRPGASPRARDNATVPDGYTPDGTPTLSYVRQRIAASLAGQEVFDQSAPAANEEARQAALHHAAAEKLKSLRESLGQPNTADEG